MKKGLKEKIKENKKTILIILLTPFIPIICIFLYSLYANHNFKGNNFFKKGEINTYCNYKYSDCWLTTANNGKNKFFYKIETQTSNPIILEERYDAILFYDKEMKIFFQKDKKIKKINLQNNYNKYNIIGFNDNIIGIEYKNNEESGYYDFKLKKVIYEKGKLLNDINSGRYIIYLTDNKINIYDKYDSKTIKENINLSSNYTKYEIFNDYETNEKGPLNIKGILGIEASNTSNGENVYYNFKTNKTLYQNQYYNFYQEFEDFIIGRKKLNIGKGYDSVDYILASNEEKVLLTPQNPNVHTAFFPQKYNGKYYYFESTDLVEPHYYTKGYIYSNNKKLITSMEYFAGDYIGQEYLINGKGELLVKKNNVISKYDIDGNLLNSKTYEKVVNLTIGYQKNEGYLVVVKDGVLEIEDTNFNKLAEIVEWKDSYQFNRYNPQYLNIEEQSDDIFNPNHAYSDGVYMVLEDSNNYTEYYFNPTNNEVKSRKIEDLDKYDLYMNWADLS